VNAASAIVHVTSCYPPHLGGVEVVAQALATQQSRQGASVVVLTTTAGSAGAPRQDREGRVTVRRYRSWSVAHTPLAPGLFVGLLRQPRAAVRHVHVAHALTTELVWLTSLIRGARFVAHFHLDVAPSGPLGWMLAPYKRFLLAPALRGADTVIALTEPMATFLISTYGVRRERIVVLRNGVSQDFLDLASERSSSSVVGRPLRLLFAGRIAPQKNLPRLLRALDLIDKPVVLTVVGDGEDRSKAERFSEHLKLGNVSFVGAKYGEEYRACLADADVFVLPSDTEGMPLAALEAMAAGLPIVATRVPGTAELVEGVGLLVEPTPEGLANAISSLVGRDDILGDLADAGRAKAASHTWPAIAEELSLHYLRTLEPR
jgi:D-inositol-3-phosphate glycosyltransferase